MGRSCTLAGANGSASGRISAYAIPELVVPRSIPITYLGVEAVFLLNFDFRGGDDGGVLPRRQSGQVHLHRAPSFVCQRAAGWRLRGHVADELHEIRILRRRLGEGAFHAVDDGSECYIAGD